jgi:hypothetical protein
LFSFGFHLVLVRNPSRTPNTSNDEWEHHGCRRY